MKIEEKDNNLIVFLNKKIAPKIDFSNKIDLERYFQKLFSKLNSIYELDLCGSYEINIYNTDYGIILEIKSQDIEYYDYYSGIDMKIAMSKYNDILYKINNYNEELKQICEFYIYDGTIYASPKNDEFQKLGILIENSEIIYGKTCYQIKKNARKLNVNALNVDKLK